ncbi:MAG: CinA family protein [Frankiaceae bacterium]
MTGPAGAAEQVHRQLLRRRATLAVAESLTGGLLCAALTDLAGASSVVRGGVVAYATPLKALLLGVPEELLASRGAVDPDVAAAMAAGARTRLGATYGVATTGVAGPSPQDGKPVGTVYVAVATPHGERVAGHRFGGDRAAVRAAATEAALGLLLAILDEGETA